MHKTIVLLAALLAAPAASANWYLYIVGEVTNPDGSTQICGTPADRWSTKSACLAAMDQTETGNPQVRLSPGAPFVLVCANRILPECPAAPQ